MILSFIAGGIIGAIVTLIVLCAFALNAVDNTRLPSIEDER